MGKSSRSKAGEEELVEPPANDRVFVPHYEDYANTTQGSCARAIQNAKNIYTRVPQESPPSVLPPSGSHQYWPSSGDGSSISSVDNYDQSASVSMQQRISEFQVALRASERAREEGQRETDSLRVYVGSVEAAAAGLLSRVQELEHLLALSSVVNHGHDIEQMRGKVATAATHEVRKHATAAAQAVAAAREATMELDKVRRETHALTKAQQEEIERLNVAAAEARILHEARDRQNQELLDHNDKLERQWVDMSSKFDELQASHKAEHSSLQKKYEVVKATAREGRAQNADLKKSLEMSKLTARSLQKKLDEMLLERKDFILQIDLLDQQVKSLQGQEVSSTISHYDHELRKVRASLGGEKTQLLTEMATLRRSNQNLRCELADWQERYKSINQHYSGLEELSYQTEHSSNRKSNSKPREMVRPKPDSSSRNTTVKGEHCMPSAREEEGDEGRTRGGVSSSASVGGPPTKILEMPLGGDPNSEDVCSQGSTASNGTEPMRQNRIRRSEQTVEASYESNGADGMFALSGLRPGLRSSRPQLKNIPKPESRGTSESDVRGISSKEYHLDAACRRIVKPKKGEDATEGSRPRLHWQGRGCIGKAEAALAWPKNVEPAGVFGPVMMFLACLLALGQMAPANA